MSILGSVSQTNPQVGQRIIIAGQEKVGKTTLTASAPNTLFVPCEMGFASVNVAKTRILTSWEDVETLCGELIAGAQAGRIKRGSTITWDSATALERFMHEYTIRTDPKWAKGNRAALTMESALGGYGKAYLYANELFGKFLSWMDQLAFYGGINIVLTCHVFPSRVTDPTAGEYDTWDLLLHSPRDMKKYGKREMATQWADLVGFLHEPMLVMKAGEGERMNRAISQNKGRILGVERTPGYVAGNRYGMTGEIAIPLQGGWNYLADAIYKTSQGSIDLYNRNL